MRDARAQVRCPELDRVVQPEVIRLGGDEGNQEQCGGAVEIVGPARQRVGLVSMDVETTSGQADGEDREDADKGLYRESARTIMSRTGAFH